MLRTLSSTPGSGLAAAVSTLGWPLLTELEVGHRIKPQPHEAFKCWSQPFPVLIFTKLLQNHLSGPSYFSYKLTYYSNFRAGCPPRSENTSGQNGDS